MAKGFSSMTSLPASRYTAKMMPITVEVTVEATEDTVFITMFIALPSPEVSIFAISPSIDCQSTVERDAMISSGTMPVFSSRAMAVFMASGNLSISSSIHSTSCGSTSHITSPTMAMRVMMASTRHTPRLVFVTIFFCDFGK